MDTVDTAWPSPAARCKIERPQSKGATSNFVAEVIPVPGRQYLENEVLENRNRFLNIVVVFLLLVVSALAVGVFLERAELRRAYDADFDRDTKLDVDHISEIANAYDRTMADSLRSVLDAVTRRVQQSRSVVDGRINASINATEDEFSRNAAQSVVRLHEFVVNKTVAEANLADEIDQRIRATRQSVDKMISNWREAVTLKIGKVIADADLKPKSGSSVFRFNVSALEAKHHFTDNEQCSDAQHRPVGPLQITVAICIVGSGDEPQLRTMLGCSRSTQHEAIDWPGQAKLFVAFLKSDNSEVSKYDYDKNEIGSCVDPDHRHDEHKTRNEYLTELKDVIDKSGMLSVIVSI